jgi:hypothetical protein
MQFARYETIIVIALSTLGAGLDAAPHPTGTRRANTAPGSTSRWKDDTAATAVPLQSVCTTSPQKGLLRLSAELASSEKGRKKYKEPYGAFLDNILRKYRSGASDIFFVARDDLTDAVARTQFILTRDYAPPGMQGRKRWVVAYLGVGANETPSWTVQGIEVSKERVRVKYTKHERAGDQTTPYVFWIPVGELMQGSYSLQLFDANRNETVVSRREIVR